MYSWIKTKFLCNSNNTHFDVVDIVLDCNVWMIIFYMVETNLRSAFLLLKTNLESLISPLNSGI